LFLCLALELGINLASERIGTQWPAKQKDVRFWFVASIVLPTPALLNPQSTPLGIRQSAVLREPLSSLLWQYHMAVLKLAVLVLLRVFNLW
jgi:hypothetical protein